jgi:hypothetical protein
LTFRYKLKRRVLTCRSVRHFNVSMLHAMLHIHKAFSCCMSMLLFHAACLSCMSVSPRCKSMSQCYKSMSPCCMSMSLCCMSIYAACYADFPCCYLCCMSVLHFSVLHVHAACPCCLSMLHVNHACRFCMSSLPAVLYSGKP